MSVKAKLIIDEKEINVLLFSFGFNQGTDTNGKPTIKPVFVGLKLIIETRKDLNLADWSFAPNQTKQLELHIYPVILGGKTRKLYFYDCHLLHWENHFASSGNRPMGETLHISAAGVKDSNSTAEYSAYWRTTYPQQTVEPTTIQESQEEEQEVGLKFIVRLERLDSYKGEFGFDWMRDDYKTICEDYEKLKKEYTPTKIYEQEYFVPWLSMFPNQQKVKLKLAITEIEGSAKDTDIIKLPSKSGIKFEPNEIKVSEANGKEITVICETPLNSNVVISLLHKDDEEVGKLNVFKNANHEQLQFNITPVRILRSISPQSDKDTIENMIDHSQGFGDKSKDINSDLQNLQEYLNMQSLNQALLKCSIGKVYDIIIDEDKWIADDLIIDEGCAFKGSLLDKFEEEFKKQHPKEFKNKGITVFLSPIENIGNDGKEGAGGYGNLGDIDSKNLAIFETNLWNKESFAHEIAHVAGLEHSFKEKDDEYNNPSILDNHNTYIKQVDDYLNYMINNGSSKKEIADFWNSKKEDYSYVRSKLNIYYRNLHKFKQGKTDNFMDYYNTKKSFWKFQWKALQDDIIKFYKS